MISSRKRKKRKILRGNNIMKKTLKFWLSLLLKKTMILLRSLSLKWKISLLQVRIGPSTKTETFAKTEFENESTTRKSIKKSSKEWNWFILESKRWNTVRNLFSTMTIRSFLRWWESYYCSLLISQIQLWYPVILFWC